mmetsp:Transcript_46863/g.52412  ORF Transcript_46863/g.52412 Transcript_46863/m.52412 type:complete len:128 (-) Transcript_46863:1549-1932(-)
MKGSVNRGTYGATNSKGNSKALRHSQTSRTNEGRVDIIITFRSKAKNPITIVTIVGTSKQATSLSKGRSNKGKSFRGGVESIIGILKVGKGIKIFGPPGFGTGTDSNRWDIYRSNGRSDEHADTLCR